MLTVDPRAHQDLETAAQWYASQRNALADEFLAAIEEAFSMIEDAPERWPMWWTRPAGRVIRRYVLRRFPFGVLYVVRDDGPLVLAIAHTRRDPRHWWRRAR